MKLGRNIRLNKSKIMRSKYSPHILSDDFGPCLYVQLNYLPTDNAIVEDQIYFKLVSELKDIYA